MSAELEYQWEWPADRATDQRLLVMVYTVKKKSSGFLGINQSPSLAASIPAPHIVSGVVIKADGDETGKHVSVVAPMLEIEDVKPHSYAVFGIVDKTTCICIVPITSDSIDINSINCSQQ